MSTPFSKVVINAPFLLVKGFLMGYMQGQKSAFPCFFHHKHGIHHENTGELMRELLHMECHTRLCLPNTVIPKLRNAFENAIDKLGTEIESVHKIKSASFTFSYHIYSEEQTGPCKELFRHVPEGVELVDYRPTEVRGAMVAGVSEFHINPYSYEGSGTVQGDFEGVMEFYLKIKRHTLCDSILVSEIKLEVEDNKRG